MKKGIFLLLACFCSIISFAQNQVKNHLLQIVFTSDAHYGISRKEFRGDSNVAAHIVNHAMIEKINDLPNTLFPHDKGVDAGKKITSIDYLIEGGDIANRMEIPDQSDATSWRQFCSDYMNGITLTNHSGKKTDLLIIPVSYTHL